MWTFKHTMRMRDSDYDSQGRSISHDHTATEIWHFFMTKARRLESKALNDYRCGALKRTLS